MKNQYVPVTLDGKKVGIAMVDNGRLLIQVHSEVFRPKLWGTASNTGIESVSIDRLEDSEVTLTIHQDSESGR